MEIELQSLNPVSPPGPNRRLSAENYIMPESQNLLHNTSQNDSGHYSDLLEIVTETADLTEAGTSSEGVQEHWKDALYMAIVNDDGIKICDLMKFPYELMAPFPLLTMPRSENNKDASTDVTEDTTQTNDTDIQFSIYATDMFGFYSEELPVDASWSMLHLASSYGNAKTVRLLLQTGANPHSRDSLGRTALDVCGCNLHEQLQDWDERKLLGVIREWANVVKILLEANVTFRALNYSRKDSKFYTLLLTKIVSEERRDLGLVRELLDAGAFVDACDYTAWECIETIVCKMAKEELQLILDYYKGGILAFITLKMSAMHSWLDGVRMALLLGASLVAIDYPLNQKMVHKYYYVGKMFPLHLAAKAGDTGVLKTILAVAKFKTSETKNYKQLCEYFPDAPKSTEQQVKYFSKLCTYTESLKEILDLIDFDYEESAIYQAVLHNHLECFKILLDHKVSILCYDQTLLHLAVSKNNIDIAKLLIDHYDYLVNEPDVNGACPLHIACEYGHKEMISILLRNRADLSKENNLGISPIGIIAKKFANPHAFLRLIFDSKVTCKYRSISNNNNFEVDIRILTPNTGHEYNVVETLVAEEQKDILTHPAIESFIYLEWKTLVYLYILALLFRIIFVLALILYIAPLYYYRDKKRPLPTFFNSTFWLCVIYIASIYYVYDNVVKIKKKCRTQRPWYIILRSIWLKTATTALHVSLPLALYWDEAARTDFCRYAASGVVIWSAMEAMYLISIVFDWGFYLIVFRKIAWIIMKLLLLPMSLVSVFAIIFMIQFRGKEPFDGIINAFMKSFAMGTMELDYSSNFSVSSNSKVTVGTLLMSVTLLVFVALVSLASFGLVNTFAITDVEDLERTGKNKILQKQIAFLASLQTSVFQRYFKEKLLLVVPYWRTETGEEILTGNKSRIEVAYSVQPFLPKHIKDSIVEIVKARIETLGEEGAKNEKLSINTDSNAFSSYNVIMVAKRQNFVPVLE